MARTRVPAPPAAIIRSWVCIKPLVHGVHLILGEKSPADSGLIGRDNQPVAQIMKLAQTLGGAWHEFQSGRVAQILAVDDQCAIAIEHDDFVGLVPGNHFAWAAAALATVPDVL